MLAFQGNSVKFITLTFFVPPETSTNLNVSIYSILSTVPFCLESLPTGIPLSCNKSLFRYLIKLKYDNLQKHTVCENACLFYHCHETTQAPACLAYYSPDFVWFTVTSQSQHTERSSLWQYCGISV